MHIRTCRLIVHAPADAACNMAADEAIMRSMDAAGADALPVLRFYQWSPPAVSIGYAQRAGPFKPQEIIAKGYGFVRRQTGGGAIFHYEEFTFSFAASVTAGQVPLDTGSVYGLVNRGILAGLRVLGIDAAERGAAWRRKREDASALFCTARPAPFDIVANHGKLVGAAQRWTRRVVLEQGFMPLKPNPVTPEVQSLQAVLGREIEFNEVAEAMRRGFSTELGIEFVPGQLNEDELQRIPELRQKYSSERWNLRL